MQPVDLNLTPEEQTTMRSLESRLTERAHFPLTFSKLVELWADFVAEVESGYSSSAPEYTNDLSSRDLIEEVLQAMPEAARSKLMACVHPLDERFTRGTHPDDMQLLGKFFKLGPGWWWSRVPIMVSGELASDLNG